jgi:TonB family protein
MAFGLSSSSSVVPPWPSGYLHVSHLEMRTSTIFASALLLTACASDVSHYHILGVPAKSSIDAAAAKHSAVLVDASATARLDQPLQVLESVFPAYTSAVLRRKITGDVRVQFAINPDGTVSDVEIIGESRPELAVLSLDAIQRWRFAPPIREGKPVRVMAAQTFSFQIQ